MMVDTLPSKEKISNIECPVAIVHSMEDDLINFKCAKILYDSLPENINKIFMPIKGIHSAPEISIEKMCELLKFADLNLEKNDMRKIDYIRDKLTIVGSKHFGYLRRR